MTLIPEHDVLRNLKLQIERDKDRRRDQPEVERLRRENQELQAQIAKLQNRLADLQLWAQDIEDNFADRVNEKVEELIGEAPATREQDSKPTELTPEEWAMRQVDATGSYIDDHGRKWVNIADCARMKGVSYQTIYRAAKRLTKTARIASWQVGNLDNGNDRILVNPDSYVRALRGKQASG